MGKHRCLRPRACIQMKKRSFGQCNYIGDCRWCLKYRKVPNYYGGRIHTSIFSKTEGTQKGIRWSEGLYNLKGSDKFDIQEKLSKPDHVTTSTPRKAKQLRSSSKMRFLHYKRKALKKKRKPPVMIKGKAKSTT